MLLPCRFLLRLLLAAAPGVAAAAQCTPEWQPGEPLPQLRGSVRATQNWDPDGAGPLPSVLVVCGEFDAGALFDTNLATWNGSEWGALPGAPAGDFRAMCVWNGQLAIAGSSVWTFDGAAWTNLGAVTGFADHASAIVVYQNSLCVVGPFAAVGGWPAHRVATYTGSGWVGLGGGFGSGTPLAVTVFNGLLHVGGDLVPGGGSAVAHLQAWTGSTWTPVGLWNGPIETLAVRNGTSAANSFLYAGGSFTVINNILAAPLVARFSPATNAWAAQGSLAAVSGATRCTRLYVRGIGISSFEVVAGAAGATNDLCWRWTGTTWTTLGNVPTGAQPTAPTAIGFYGSEYIVGIAPPTGATPSSLYRLAGFWQSVRRHGFSGDVYSVGTHAGEPVIAGAFTSIGGLSATRIARGRPGAWQTFGSGLSGPVFALATLANGDLIAAGAFTSAGGIAANHVARWDGASWHALGSGTNATVLGLAVTPDGDLFAAGSFTAAGGVAASRIARWDGTAWHALGSGVDGELNAVVALANGDVVVGGTLTMAGGIPASRIARWDGTAWHALGAGLGSGLSGTAYAMAVAPDGELWVCGNYRFAGGVPANRLARWNGSAWSAAPSPPFGTWSSDLLDIAVLPDGSVAVGGYMQAGGSSAWRLVGGTWTSLQVDGTVSELGVGGDGALLAVGTFEQTGGEVALAFGEWSPGCAPAAPAYGNGCAGTGGPDVLTATTLPWDGQTLRTRATGLPQLSLALVIYGFSQISVPIAALLPEGLPGCDLLVAPDILGLALANAGAVDSEVFIAPLPSLVGVTFYHQVLPLELDAGAAIVAITATNGLALTVGSY